MLSIDADAGYWCWVLMLMLGIDAHLLGICPPGE